MKVILKDYVRKLGDVGDVVNVKEGFARNFLLPNELAVIASDENLKRIESIKRLHQEKHKHLIAGFQDMAERLKGKSVTITCKVNEAGRLYGSIGEREIADALNQAFSTTVEPSCVEVGSHIKEPGAFPVHIRFTVGISADAQVIVAAEGPPEQPPAAAHEQPEKAPKPKTLTDEARQAAPAQRETEGKAEKPAKPRKASRPPDAAEAPKTDRKNKLAASANADKAAKPAPSDKPEK